MGTKNKPDICQLMPTGVILQQKSGDQVKPIFEHPDDFHIQPGTSSHLKNVFVFDYNKFRYT
jgi:hypothetical protein